LNNRQKTEIFRSPRGNSSTRLRGDANDNERNGFVPDVATISSPSSNMRKIEGENGKNIVRGREVLTAPIGKYTTHNMGIRGYDPKRPQGRGKGSYLLEKPRCFG